MPSAKPIDFVIPWVDGDDPLHIKKRAEYSGTVKFNDPNDSEQSTGEQRFIQDDELRYCLRSIVNYAPWYNKIWIVTDGQVPSFLDQARLKHDRIEIIDHSVLFQHEPQNLPQFNTRSILTNMDKIPGIADIAIIGNDDTFFAQPVSANLFEQQGRLNVYGDMIDNQDERFNSLHFDALKLSASLLNPNSTQYLMLSHGFMPTSIPAISELRTLFPAEFVNNTRHKFRHRSQFLIEALVSQYLVEQGRAKLQSTEKMVHFSFQLCRQGTEEKLKFLFSLIESGQRNMFCLNDFSAIKQRFDWVENKLTELCGSPINCEVNSL